MGPALHGWEASLVFQLVKNLPTTWETWVRSLGLEDPWRRERLPTPVFWPGEFHGLYSPCGHKELDTTEWLSLSLHGWQGCPWCHWELQTGFLGSFPFWVKPSLYYLCISPQSHSEQVQSHSKAGLWFSTDIIGKPSLVGNSSHSKHKPSSAQPMQEPWAWVPAICYLVTPLCPGPWVTGNSELWYPISITRPTTN